MRAILVPLDGSASAEAALPVALALVRRNDARLVLATAIEPPPSVRGGQGALVFDQRLDTERRAAMRQYLRQVTVRLLGEDGSLPIEARFLEGPAAATIVQAAQESGAELVVLTSHGHGGASRLWLGSITDALVRQLRVPILVLRADDGTPVPPAGRFRRILVPLDGAPQSEQGIHAATALAGRDGVHYTLVRVVELLHPLLQTVASEQDVEIDIATQRSEAERYLADVEARLGADGLDVRGEVRVSRYAAPAIVGVAEEIGADLLSVATHGRGRAGRLLLGSVADKLLRTAHIPVLVSHVDEEDRRAPAPEGR
jgi:nucleotide-binding universal stress UspA family protein